MPLRHRAFSLISKETQSIHAIAPKVRGQSRGQAKARRAAPGRAKGRGPLSIRPPKEKGPEKAPVSPRIDFAICVQHWVSFC